MNEQLYFDMNQAQTTYIYERIIYEMCLYLDESGNPILSKISIISNSGRTVF